MHYKVFSPFNYPLAFYSKVPEPSPKEALFYLRQPFSFSTTVIPLSNHWIKGKTKINFKELLHKTTQ